MQAVIIDLQIGNPAHHLHAAPNQAEPMSPAGGTAQRLARRAVAALQDHHLAVGLFNLRHQPGHTAARVVDEIDAPFAAKGRDIHGRRRAGMGDQRRHIEPDAPCPHDGHAAANGFAAQDRVNIRHRLGVIDPRHVGRARTDAGGDDHLVMAGRRQHVSIHTGIEFQRNAQLFDHPAEIAQRFVELLLARHPLGQVELAADFRSGIIDRQLVAALGGFHGKGQPRRPGANHGQIALGGGRHHRHQRFIAGARIDQA